MAYECLIDLVGITDSTCQCEITGLNNETLTGDWHKKTISGLYLDDLEGIVPIQAVGQSATCANEMAKWYYDAKASAIKTLADDIIIGITQRAVNGKKTYRGKMGGTSYSGVMPIVGAQYAGVKIYTIPMKGGTLKIKAINTMMSADASFNLYIYKLDRGSSFLELIITIPNVLSLANAVKVNTLTEPISIDLSEYGADFYFIYEPIGFNPKQNSVSCGCGNVEWQFKAYAQMSGVTISDLINPSFQTYSSALGLSFEGEVGCNTTKIICEAFNNDEAVKTVMAYAARFKAGELVQEYVSKSGNINRYTMVSQESIWGKRNHFRAEYNTRLNWLIANIDLNLIDCYVCNDKRITKGGILA